MTRKQMNFRLDQELQDVIDDMRRLQRPIPSVSAVVRQAIQEKADRELKKPQQRAKG